MLFPRIYRYRAVASRERVLNNEELAETSEKAVQEKVEFVSRELVLAAEAEYDHHVSENRLPFALHRNEDGSE